MLPWRVPIDFAGAGLGVAGAFIVYGVYWTRLFTLLPIALPEVLRHDPNGVLLADREGRLLFWNPSARSILPTLDLAPDLELYPALARELRRIDPEVRVLLSSGFDETDAMTRLAGAKLAGFAQKPYRAVELLDRIRRAL